MKKFNCLNPFPDASERPGLSRGNVSRPAKRLVIISIVGIVLVSAVYWYINGPLMKAPPPPTQSRAPLKLPQAKPEVVKPEVATLKELLWSILYEQKATRRVLVRKGLLSNEEVLEEVKVVRRELEGKRERQDFEPDGQLAVPEKTPEPEKPQAAVPPKVGALRKEGSKVESSPVETPRAEFPEVGVPSKVPSEVAKPAQTPQPKPAETPAQAEKPASKPLTEATEPDVKREKQYTLQVATLVVERNAITLKKRLEELGYAPIVHTTTAPITHHRVFGGEFNSREEAEQTAGRLNADGFSTNLVELEDGTFGPEVGSYFSLNEAIDLAHSLQKKNYTPKIASKAVPTPVYAVRIGDYDDQAEVQKAVEALKEEGFTPLIVRQ